MLITKLAKLLYLCGLSLLLVALLPATASNSKGIGAMLADKNPSPYRKVTANSNDVTTIKKLQEAGAIELTPPEWRESSWPSHTTLWNVPVEQLQRLSANIKLNIKDEYDKLFANGIEFYPLAGEPPIPHNLRQAKRDGKQMWMLHFIEPQEMQVRNWLGERGISIVKTAGWAGLVVWVDSKQLTELETAVNPNGPILWTGAYHPYYRLDDDIRDYVTKLGENPTGSIKVHVSLHKHPDVEVSHQKLLALAIGDIIFNFGGPGEEWATTIAHDMEVPISELVNIANWYDTYSIGLYYPVQLLDEMQGQLIAGNVEDTPPLRPRAPGGYLGWLQDPARGFSFDPAAYPIVGIIDTGLDTRPGFTHPDFYEQGNPANSSRIAAADTCTPDTLTYDRTGHGTLGAGIIAGYNITSTDVPGYSRGLGISPFGKLVSLRVFLTRSIFNAGSCEQRYSVILNRLLTHNPKIANLSLGVANPDYSDYSAVFDTYTRSSSAFPNRPLFFSIAAGNSGRNSELARRKVGTPANAKNVLTVGATMNTRGTGVTDSCGNSDSGDANEIAPFSSIGTTPDGRAKPDVVAPGVHIQGAAPQDTSVFTLVEVCGEGTLNRYYPAGQTLHTWANGTSFAAPAVAGAAQLLFNYYKRVLDPGRDPSPAMAKALLINSARYLTGGGAGDRLPSPTQGWGMVNLGTLFGYTPANTFVLDQSHVFAQSNSAPFQLYGRVADKTKPVRFSLVWTDPPAQTRCNPDCLVNNLDLEVNMFGDRTYKGNVFTNAFSEPTVGDFDTLNNVENVYLAADNGNDRFVVSIRPFRLRGDGVPGNTTPIDQDFALVIHNAADVVPTGLPTTFERQTVSVNDGSGGNGNNAPEPGELIYLSVPLKNTGSEDAVAVSSQLSLNQAQPAVTLVDERSTYLDILTNAAEKNQTPFSFRLEPAFDCGTPVTLSQTTTYNGSVTVSSVFTLATGALGIGNPTTYDGPAINIPQTTTVSSVINIPTNVSGKVGKIKVKLSVDHEDNSNLYVKLYAPNGGHILLFNTAAGSNNFNNVSFDDTASNTVPGLIPTGGYSDKTYRPQQPFDNLAHDGQMPPLAGQWRLEIQDASLATPGTGWLKDWAVILQADNVPMCLPYTPDAAKFVTAQDGTPQSGAIGTVFLPLQARVTDTKGNPIRGIPVTFQAPANGPSGAFPNGSRTLVVTTDVDGLATANSLRATNQPGSYLVTAGVGVSGASPAQFALTNVAGEATSLSIASGNQQGTLPNSPFGAPLVVQLRDSAGNPVAGQGVTFTPPDTRAGGIAGGDFSGTPDIEGSSWTVFTDNSGRATASTLTANEIVGNYVVVASSGQLSTNFSLHNLTACNNGINPFVVTSASDDGSGLNCGTLSRALLQAVSGTTINFSLGGASTVAIAGSLPPVRAGVTLSGGSSCGANLLTLDGVGTSGVGLRLEGGATLQNLCIRGFGKPQIEAGNAGSGSNNLLCVRVQQ